MSKDQLQDNKVLQAILNRISSMENTLKEEIEHVRKDVQKNGKRLDMIGSAVAYLEDDTPTREEFDNLNSRVTKLEASL